MIIFVVVCIGFCAFFFSKVGSYSKTNSLGTASAFVENTHLSFFAL
jgi:hypothetical protein